MKLQGPNFFLFKDTLKNYHFRLLVFMCYIHLHICEYVLHDVNWRREGASPLIAPYQTHVHHHR